MEGLIKGLLDVALGGGNNDDGERRDNREDSQSSSDQIPRSTWAQVVTGEQNDDGNRIDSYRNDHPTHKDEEIYRRTEEWESSGSQHMIRPKKEHGGYNENREDNYTRVPWNRKGHEESNDGWETVGKKAERPKKHVRKNNWNDYKRHASEQNFSPDTEPRESLYPTEEELSDLGLACNKLWELDLNRLVPGKNYEIDVGEGKKIQEKGDAAQGSLLSWVAEDVFRRPTFSRFCSLLDNYDPNQGHKEVVTSEEKQEQGAFIEEISRTAPIKYLYNYLSSKGIMFESFDTFKKTMNDLWFGLYNRGGTYGSSSAFEHVFVGEIKQHGEQEVSGFHNWLQFYLEETEGRVDYQGYILPRRRGEIPDAESQLLTIQFGWNGVMKSVSSTFIGVSPEFELALYTLCFYVGGEDNHVEIGPYPVNIKCYRMGNNIGSVFPIADS